MFPPPATSPIATSGVSADAGVADDVVEGGGDDDDGDGPSPFCGTSAGRRRQTASTSLNAACTRAARAESTPIAPTTHRAAAASDRTSRAAPG